MVLADPPRHLDRFVRHRIGATEVRHRAGGGVGEPVRQQVQELTELVGVEGVEAGGQVLDVELGHLAGQPVVEGVGQAAVHPGLAGPFLFSHFDGLEGMCLIRRPV